MADKKSAASSPAAPAAALATSIPAAAPSPGLPPPAAKTVLSSSIAQTYLRPQNLSAGAAVTYRPALLASARLHFVDLKQGLDSWQTVRHLVLPDPVAGTLRWTETRPAPEGEENAPVSGAFHENVPAALSDPKRFAQHERDYKDFLSQISTLELFSLPAHKLVANPGESEGDFRIRAGQLLREKRESEVDGLRKKYAAKLDTLGERERRAAAKVENEKAQLSRQQLGTMVSFGTAALSILLGRRMGGIGRASTGIGSMTRAGKEKLDVQQAGETLEAIRQQRAELESEAEREIAEVMQSYDPANLVLSTVRIEPRRSDTAIQQIALAWIPYAPDSSGALRPAVDL